MPKRNSKSKDANEKSSSDEAETATQGVSEYEKQRLSRIAENRARLEALGLPKMASSFNALGHNKVRVKKGKEKVEDDEEYTPDEVEARSSSSSGDDGHEDEDEDFVSEKTSRSRKRKMKLKHLKPKARASRQERDNRSYQIDDDEALKQAIALSLQDSAKVSSCSDKHVVNTTQVEMKGNAHNQEDNGKRKNKKSFASRLQMTEDEVIVHFFQMDEAGKGSVSIRDLQRVATAHDFTWTDKELADMIRYFDSDGDGKLSFDDFQKIVVRCNMIKGSENF
ncbi:RNA polymerase-associated protein LEO1-like [Senna tora]|uniref:RNA polymerase-associated protein LEO1-like n=1 Tax=Senna tora TaxID=362788 RepID=A0A835CIV6_9FABA|nr:RNA polymerase-associated protein LEO1-like [Senna tora]